MLFSTLNDEGPTADTAPQQIELFSKLNIHVLHKPINFQEILRVMEGLLKIKPNSKASSTAS